MSTNDNYIPQETLISVLEQSTGTQFSERKARNRYKTQWGISLILHALDQQLLNYKAMLVEAGDLLNNVKRKCVKFTLMK